MNIFDHLIPDSAILGIGPLFMENHPDPAAQNIYWRRRYVFDLHLSAHTTLIKSDWFDVFENKDEQVRMKTWKDQYFSVREKIAALIHEETDKRKLHLQEVEKVHADAIYVFESLVKKLHPADVDEPAVQVINAEKQRVLDDLLELKVLASSN